MLKEEMTSVVLFHKHQWSSLVSLIEANVAINEGLICLLQDKRRKEEVILKQLFEAFSSYIDLPILPTEKFLIGTIMYFSLLNNFFSDTIECNMQLSTTHYTAEHNLQLSDSFVTCKLAKYNIHVHV